MATRSRNLHLLLLLSLLSLVLALQVTPNSPCSSQCIDSSTLDESDPNSSTTTTDDIVCEDADLTSSSTGSKWKSCMGCLQNSTYAQDNESDQQWFLYNLRYSFDYCVYGYPNSTGSGSNPCETSTACGALRTAMEYGNLSTESSEFGYCDADGGSVTGSYYDACLNCVSAGGDTNSIANSLVALEAACEQRPNTTDLLGLSGSVFSSSIINIVDPSTVNGKSTEDAVPLSTAAIAGIAAGAGALVIIAAALTFVCCRRRRNRANLNLEPRWGKTSRKHKHKRRSSFSFRCRNIIASPISPKFFRDLSSPVDEQQPYGSLDEQMASAASSGTVVDSQQQQSSRYYIESKQNLWRHPYETSLDGWGIQQQQQQESAASLPPSHQPVDPSVDQWNTFSFPAEKKGSTRAKKIPPPMMIDTGLSAPPEAHKSPKQNVFEISRAQGSSRPQQQQQQQQQQQPTTTTYVPAEQFTTHASANCSPSRGGNPKPKTTTMSSQGSGYPKLKSPTWAPSFMRPGAGAGAGAGASTTTTATTTTTVSSSRDGGQHAAPWFPPPPPGPPPASSSSLASRYGRKVSGGTGSTSPRTASKRESGSPVESKQIQVVFPGPPGR